MSKLFSPHNVTRVISASLQDPVGDFPVYIRQKWISPLVQGGCHVSGTVSFSPPPLLFLSLSEMKRRGKCPCRRGQTRFAIILSDLAFFVSPRNLRCFSLRPMVSHTSFHDEILAVYHVYRGIGCSCNCMIFLRGTLHHITIACFDNVRHRNTHLKFHKHSVSASVFSSFIILASKNIYLTLLQLRLFSWDQVKNVLTVENVKTEEASSSKNRIEKAGTSTLHRLSALNVRTLHSRTERARGHS